MISWPAEKLIRWVKPSIATVSPSRTIAATASCIEVTFEVLIVGPRRVLAAGLDARDRAGRQRGLEDLAVLRRDVGDGLPEEPQRRRHLSLRDGQGGRHPDARSAAFQDEQAALEGGPLDLLGVV